MQCSLLYIDFFSYLHAVEAAAEYMWDTDGTWEPSIKTFPFYELPPILEALRVELSGGTLLCTTTELNILYIYTNLLYVSLS